VIIGSLAQFLVSTYACGEQREVSPRAGSAFVEWCPAPSSAAAVQVGRAHARMVAPVVYSVRFSPAVRARHPAENGSVVPAKYTRWCPSTSAFSPVILDHEIDQMFYIMILFYRPFVKRLAGFWVGICEGKFGVYSVWIPSRKVDKTTDMR
jgi:hypothetical protein